MRDEQSRGFGVAAGLDPEVARPLAERCAELGYRSMSAAMTSGGVRSRAITATPRSTLGAAAPNSASVSRPLAPGWSLDQIEP